VDDKAPPPLPTRPMTSEEAERALEEIKRMLAAAAADKADKVA